MKVTLRLYARAKDLAGQDTLEVEVPEGTTVGGLREQLKEWHSGLKGLIDKCAFAVDEEFAADSHLLSHGAKVALLPPVSGGQASTR